MAVRQGSGVDRLAVPRWTGLAPDWPAAGFVMLESTFLGHQGWMFAAMRFWSSLSDMAAA
jgi:hypothetical protein